MEQVHRESLEEEATHATDEARMILPGVQAIMGFQLIAVFNQRFEHLAEPEQLLHFAAFVLVAVTMGLIMAPAAFHRQAERGMVSRQFVDLASRFLCWALVPFSIATALETYILSRLIFANQLVSLVTAVVVLACFIGLWFVLPWTARRRRQGGGKLVSSRTSPS